jgi:hypothetical protein
LLHEKASLEPLVLDQGIGHDKPISDTDQDRSILKAKIHQREEWPVTHP